MTLPSIALTRRHLATALAFVGFLTIDGACSSGGGGGLGTLARAQVTQQNRSAGDDRKLRTRSRSANLNEAADSLDRKTRRRGSVRVTALAIFVSMVMLPAACASCEEKVSGSLRSKISDSGEGVAAVVRQRAAALGANTLQAPVEPLTQPYVDGIVGAVDQLKDAAKGLGDGDANLLVYVGARYAVYKVADGGGLGTLDRTTSF